MHDCVGLKCTINPNGALRRQENTQQLITIPAVKHESGKQYILNTNMIRSGHLLRALYGAIPDGPTLSSIARKAAQRLAEGDNEDD
jgi:hypothetical protein